MKPILLSLIVFLLTACSINSGQVNDLSLENLHGQVREIKSKTYITSTEKSGKEKTTFWSTRITKYNKKGNLTETKAIYYPDSATQEVHVAFVNYDKNGMKASITNDKNKTIKDFTAYNEDDLATETYNYDDFGNFIRLERYAYENKLLKETDVYSDKRVLYSKIIYERDNRGCIKQISIYDFEGNLYSKTIYTFDAEKRMVSYKGTGKNYKSNGLFKYGTSDKNNNWLLNKKYENNKLIGFEEREISYY